MTFGLCNLEAMGDPDKSGFHGETGITNLREGVQMKMGSEENNKKSSRPRNVSTICCKYS